MATDRPLSSSRFWARLPGDLPLPAGAGALLDRVSQRRDDRDRRLLGSRLRGDRRRKRKLVRADPPGRWEASRAKLEDAPVDGTITEVEYRVRRADTRTHRSSAGSGRWSARTARLGARCGARRQRGTKPRSCVGGWRRSTREPRRSRSLGRASSRPATSVAKWRDLHAESQQRPMSGAEVTHEIAYDGRGGARMSAAPLRSSGGGRPAGRDRRVARAGEPAGGGTVVRARAPSR